MIVNQIISNLTLKYSLNYIQIILFRISNITTILKLYIHIKILFDISLLPNFTQTYFLKKNYSRINTII